MVFLPLEFDEVLSDWFNMEPARKVCVRKAPKFELLFLADGTKDKGQRRTRKISGGKSIQEFSEEPKSRKRQKLSFSVDVGDIRPEHLKITCVDDQLLISGDQPEREDEFGFISRQFQRRCPLPSDIDLSTLRTHLTKDGQLMVRAAFKKPEEPKPIEIPIQIDLESTLSDQSATESPDES